METTGRTVTITRAEFDAIQDALLSQRNTLATQARQMVKRGSAAVLIRHCEQRAARAEALAVALNRRYFWDSIPTN